MIKVAVTGGIGAGKSIVCQVFSKLKVPVFNADLVAKKLTDEDDEIKTKLIALFGNDIYLRNGTLHRKKLAEIIFNDKIALRNVNNIIHPKVYENFTAWCKKQESPYIIQEAAIVFENKHTKRFDKIITVTAPDDVKITRVIKRDKTTKDQVVERMKNQLPDAFKMKHSDFVIHNNGTQLMIPQILKIDKELR